MSKAYGRLEVILKKINFIEEIIVDSGNINDWKYSSRRFGNTEHQKFA